MTGGRARTRTIESIFANAADVSRNNCYIVKADRNSLLNINNKSAKQFEKHVMHKKRNTSGFFGFC